MKDKLLFVYQCIVGFEVGIAGEGNEQWYYFLALVMDCMLTWWLKPELGILFTIVAVLHFITVCIYGYQELDYYSIWFSIGYYAIHLILLIICFLFNWSWTLITAALVVVGVLIAPDCTGMNIFLRKDYNFKGSLFFHTIWFLAFVIITMLLPITLWIRLLIICACMALHPLIDYLQGECMIITDVTEDSLSAIIEKIHIRR